MKKIIVSKKQNVNKLSVKYAVYESSNYDEFKFWPLNRSIKESHIMKLLKAIQQFLFVIPILVFIDEKGKWIIDGQHRFVVCTRLKIPVPYIVVNERPSIEFLSVINSTLKVWQNYTYLSTWVKAGYKGYKAFSDFLESTGLLFDAALSLVTLNTPGEQRKGLINTFRDGSLNEYFIKTDWKFMISKFCEIKEILLRYVRNAGLKENQIRSERFIQGYMRIAKMKGFKRQHFFQKVKENGSLCCSYNKQTDYIKRFVKIYNTNSNKSEYIK
jgi:hypothetical protein